MAIQKPQAARLKRLEDTLHKTLVVRLYSAVTGDTITDTTDVVNFTEHTDTDYLAVTLSSASASTGWVMTADTALQTQAIYHEATPREFSFSTAATVVGYYVVDTDSALRWCEKLPTAATFAGAGGTFELIPAYTTRAIVIS